MSLRRYTPLRARRLYRPPPRREEDKITPGLAEYIYLRDRICLAARLDSHHRCRNRWGEWHPADKRSELRIAHVKEHARMGVRAEPQKNRLVLECDDANNNWSSANRDRERQYLSEVEPDV